MDTTEFKGLLEERRREIQDAIRRKRQEGLQAEKAADPIDNLILIHGRESAVLDIERDRKKLQAAVDALERIESGTYGICEVCDEQIPERRLQIVPDASLCTRCAEEAERLAA